MKKKSKKRKIKKKNFQFFKKLNEDQQTNLILLGILAFAGLLYYFGFLGTLVKGALSLWVLWALLAGFCAALLYWRETIGFILVVFGMIIVTGFAFSFYDNFTYKRCVNKFKERPYTYDIKKFAECGMIKYSDIQGKSHEEVFKEMVEKYFRK